MDLLTTKLYVLPARLGILLVPRLYEQLNLGILKPLTLISAPAGCGKTSLVSTQAATCGQAVAWLGLAEGDNDPVIFWRYVVTALQLRLNGIGHRTISMLQSAPFSELETSLIPLINELSEISNPISLVLAIIT